MAILDHDYIIESFAYFVYGNKTDENQIRDLQEHFRDIVNYEDDNEMVLAKDHAAAVVLMQRLFIDGLNYLSQKEKTDKYQVFISEIAGLDTADKMVDWVSRLIPEQGNLDGFL